MPQLIEDLRKQLEHLQLYKLEAEAKRGRSPGAGLQEYQTRTREAELEQEIKRLKQVETFSIAWSLKPDRFEMEVLMMLRLP